jgi:acyl-coenzyme A thioesterase 13
MSTGNAASTAWRVNLSLSPADRIEAITRAFESNTASSGWDARFCRDREIYRLISTPTSAGSPNAFAIFELTITPYLCNVGDNPHGGAATTIFDDLSSAVIDIAARKGFLDHGSVSRTLTMTFLRAVPLGAQCRVELELVAAGRMMANVKGVIRDSEGRVCVSCMHDKGVFHGPSL